jgi:precorrin-2 methylase
MSGRKRKHKNVIIDLTGDDDLSKMRPDLQRKKKRKGLQLTNFLMSLPSELLVVLASYLTMKDQRTFSHCNKSSRTQMKSANLIRYKLSDESCRRYVDDLFFREVVESRGRVWDLRLYEHPTMDVTFLSRVHTLTLWYMPGVTDVSALSSVHDLTLMYMPGVTDVSALSQVHTLYLRDMPGVTDVSALSSVHTLSLDNMAGVTDVSALSQVHTLTLENMPGVTDVSALSKVHTLTLGNMPGVTDVSALSQVHTLKLWGMDGVTDVSALSQRNNMVNKFLRRNKST